MAAVNRYVPPFIYCPRCGSKIEIEELEGSELENVKAEGYVSGGKGVCKCGVVVVLCVQELPRSPTFSLFFDVYNIPREKANILASNRIT